MVMASPKRSVVSGAKWSLYIFLATSVNLALASLVSIDMQPKSKSIQPPMQLSLLSAPTPSQQQESATAEPVETAAIQPAPTERVMVEGAEKTAVAQPMAEHDGEAEKPEAVGAEPITDSSAAASSKATVTEATPPSPSKSSQPATSNAQVAQSNTPDTKPAPKPDPVEVAHADVVATNQPAHRPRSLQHDRIASTQTTVAAPKLVHNAQYRYQVPPQYPRRALELGQEGLVMMHVKVMQNGRPGEMKIVHSSGYRLLDIAALSAVRKWEFEPMSTSGAAMASWVRVPVNFTIEK